MESARNVKLMFILISKWKNNERNQAMISNHSKFALTLLVISFILWGCATVPIEEGPSPDSKLISPGISKVAVVDVDSTSTPGYTIRNLYEVPGHETIEKEIAIEANTVSTSDAEPTKIEVIPSSIKIGSKTDPVVSEEEHPSTSDENTVKRSNDLIVIARTDRVDRELTYNDSISYLVMILPNDYLGRIAMREYNNPSQWRSIYYWNRILIGDDPNAIYPYHELKLFKPEHEIASRSYDYIIHVVIKGETLWSIAADWYGDNLAWSILYWDNEELLNSSGGRLINGTELRIRTNLLELLSEDLRVSSTDRR